MARAILVAATLGALPFRCDPEAGWGLARQAEPREPRGVSIRPADNAARSRHPASIQMEALDSSNPATFVLRGEPHGPGKLLFIHGMCGHALGYAQSFQFSAAKHGVLVAPQGDVPCAEGSPWAKWSSDTARLDARVVSAFRALGFAEPIEDITAIGYSQGASRAEALARAWPKRYTRLILIAGPTRVSPYGLHVHSALLMAGSLDRQDLMQASAKAFAAAGRRARYMQLPDARHGSMGSNPEATMNAALAWIYEPNATPSGMERPVHPSGP